MAQYLTGAILAEYVPGVQTAELIRTGGQKAVYKATIEEQVVALKVVALQSEEVDDEEVGPDARVAVERAQREVDILDRVDVPFLARSGPLGLATFMTEDEKWLYFTEEWIEGTTLREMIGVGRLSPKKVARLGVDLVRAACWLSERGLVHRDIKPDNIMWAIDRSRFVLLDPGIAFDLYGPSLTRLPVPVGTMAYLSPEQMDPARKRSLDFRSDLFAIGVVLYEAAVAEHPFMAVHTTPAQVMTGILFNTPKCIADRLEGFPPGLSGLITRLLGKSPHLRYRRCDLARAAIEDVADSLGVEA